MWRINNCAILFSASPPNHRKEKEEEMATSLVSLHPERMRNNNITGEQWRASSHYHQMSSHKHLAAKKSGDLGLRPCATYEAIHQIGTEFWTRHYMKFLKQMDRQADAWQTAIMELPVAAKTATTSPDIQARSRLSPSVILIGGIQAWYQIIHVYTGTWMHFVEELSVMEVTSWSHFPGVCPAHWPDLEAFLCLAWAAVLPTTCHLAYRQHSTTRKSSVLTYTWLIMKFFNPPKILWFFPAFKDIWDIIFPYHVHPAESTCRRHYFL